MWGSWDWHFVGLNSMSIADKTRKALGDWWLIFWGVSGRSREYQHPSAANARDTFLSRLVETVFAMHPLSIFEMTCLSSIPPNCGFLKALYARNMVCSSYPLKLNCVDTSVISYGTPDNPDYSHACDPDCLCFQISVFVNFKFLPARTTVCAQCSRTCLLNNPFDRVNPRQW